MAIPIIIILVLTSILLAVNSLRLYIGYAGIIYYCCEKGYELDTDEIKKAMYKVVGNLIHGLRKS